MQTNSPPKKSKKMMIDVEVMSLNEKEDHGQNTRMHMCVCLCMHVCGCVCACVQVCLCACVRVEHTVDRRVRHMSLAEKEDHSAYTCVCACVCVCVGVCHGVGACISVCVCACVCVQSLSRACTHAHTLFCVFQKFHQALSIYRIRSPLSYSYV